MGRHASRIPVVGAAQNCGYRNGGDVCCRERLGPAGAIIRFRPRPSAAEFGITRGSFTLGTVPIVPAHRPHDLRHIGVEECHLGKVPPGTPEIRLDVCGFARNLAIGKHETVALFCGRRRGGNVAVTPRMNVASLEEGRRRTKNEVHMPSDQRILEVVTAAVEQNRVLPAQEAAITEDGTIAVYTQCQSLTHGACAVLKRDVFGGEIVCVNENRRGAKRADRSPIRADHVRVEVIRNDSPDGIFSNERDEPLLALYIHHLAIDTCLYKDQPTMTLTGCLRYGVDGLLNCFVVAGPIGRDNSVRRRALRAEDWSKCEGQYTR